MAGNFIAAPIRTRPVTLKASNSFFQKPRHLISDPVQDVSSCKFHTVVVNTSYDSDTTQTHTDSNYGSSFNKPQNLPFSS